MKKKKLALAIVGLFSVITLAACSNSGTELVTMKGGKITQEEFFDQIKTQDANQQALQSAIIYKVAENGFGDKVDKKDIDAKYKESEEQLGGADAFKDALKNAGLTEASYKAQIKQQLAFEAMMKSHVKITDAELKETWKTFHPEVEVQLIAMDDEAKAKEVLEKANKGDDFGKLAKENSTDASSAENGKVTFDSTSLEIPAEVQEAAFKLKKDEVSALIPVVGNNGMTEITTYYIVKMVKPQDKGNEMEPFKKELKEIATDAKLADQAFQQEVISKELKAANVKIKDEDLKGVLAGFIEEETKASSTAESSTKESKTKESSAKESSTKESSTKESAEESSTEESK
ncbi:peptidylprolyl isomerase [Vagococcus sp. BWB3-3]|uniref:Foldase protein PrsA n=1 Tax=Vagococcus allomyrinae TaxID=2794353 RepID=A0A940P1R5_9ENTE|nr:peptidylprolyl isomerase [Vagococcus allomyrinae]MBP1039877.1 peptidylprolyl isomerase [Vagococcus allomyrinae]